MLIDTFLIRPLVVPAILSVSPCETQWNWVPYRVPAVALSEADKQGALAAGCDAPAQFRSMTREPAPAGPAGATDDLHIDA